MNDNLSRILEELHGIALDEARMEYHGPGKEPYITIPTKRGKVELCNDYDDRNSALLFAQLVDNSGTLVANIPLREGNDYELDAIVDLIVRVWN